MRSPSFAQPYRAPSWSSRARTRVVAATSAAAVALTLAAAGPPAAAMPVADVPVDPLTWASTPYSPLTPTELAPDNDVALEFDGTGGGLHGAGDIDTGFSLVQPASAKISSTDPAQRSAYLPQNLTVAGGNLTVATTKGIAFAVYGPNGNDATRNKQDNTLGVPLDTDDKKVRLSTTLQLPTSANNAAQAGLWFGPNDDNFVKLAVTAPSTSTAAPTTGAPAERQIQLLVETNGVTNTNANSPSQKVFSTNTNTITGTTPVTLTMDVDPVTDTATAFYRIGTGAEVNLGTVAVPANFTDGSALLGGVEASGLGGIYATKRNMAESANVPVVFERFATTAAPSAVGNLTGGGDDPTAAQLAWVAPRTRTSPATASTAPPPRPSPPPATGSVVRPSSPAPRSPTPTRSWARPGTTPWSPSTRRVPPPPRPPPLPRSPRPRASRSRRSTSPPPPRLLPPATPRTRARRTRPRPAPAG
ncbi:hypothetical protein [Serinibacter arcticus]|uniref:hypothetical protein n=1 Tax=Serinibacter arcticus TaxID=1655435 RepID=UPI001F1953BD|nr:hypothetical protein [Serinibacter arcticus]